MRCQNCGEDRFERREYRSSDIRAPALECADCHVLALDPEAAESEQERDSVRLAIAARTAIIEDEEPPTRPDLRSLSGV